MYLYSKALFGGVALSLALLLGGCATEPMQGTASGQVSDASLREDVSQAIQQVPGIGPTDLSVTTQNGVVNLRGRTRTRTEAQNAIEAARHVPGVEKVDYDIQVDEH